ncbi:Light-sensor Protein kinase [Curvularia kusanoi]|uniref:Light-sensor Protein kinase n=1 Tax=Curvularia kusanoi TaxID=90978 RepID=A0A9P4TIK4_CURKU|nr:Light-sensor Protein kinase [Curvularia kusanoi]
MSSIEAKLAAAPDLSTLSEALVKIVEKLTGFERVMIHRSDSSGDGRIFTEFVNPRISQYVEKLNSPIEDVLFEFQKSQNSDRDQLLHDRKLPHVRLLYRTSDATKPPLDLTCSYLRVISRLRMAHAKHLDVRSLMSISIDLPTGVWGSIVCHSYGTTVTRTSFPSRKLCRFVSNVAARSIQSLLSRWHVQAWKDLDKIFLNRHTEHRSAAASENLLQLFQADFGILSTGPKTKILGHIHHAQEALAVLEYFKVFGTRSVAASFDVNRDVPKLKYIPNFEGIAETLVIRAVDKSGSMILLFRGPRPLNQVQPGASSLGPGLISHKRDTWTEGQMEAATVLCSMPDEFIRAWAEEDALPLSRMMQLLLHNLSHDIRTPLNAIVNYLEVALEGPLDSETRNLLSASQVRSEELIRAVMKLSRTFEV